MNPSKGVLRRCCVLVSLSLVSLVPALAKADEASLAKQCAEAGLAGLKALQTQQYLIAGEHLERCVSTCGKAASAAGPAVAELRETLELCESGLAKRRSDIPSIVVTATSESGADIADGRLLVDGEARSSYVLGAPIEVDPGTHEIVLERVGTAPLKMTIVAAVSKKLRPVELEATAVPPPPVAASQPPVAASPPPVAAPLVAATADHSETTWSGLETAGIVVGAFGIAAVGVGVGFGIDAHSKNIDSQDFCDSGNTCNSKGASLREGAFTAAHVATAALVIGGVAVAGGTAMFVLAPSGTEQTTIRVGPSSIAINMNW